QVLEGDGAARRSGARLGPGSRAGLPRRAHERTRSAGPAGVPRSHPRVSRSRHHGGLLEPHPSRRRADLRPRLCPGQRTDRALGHARRSLERRGGRRRGRGPGAGAAPLAASLRRRVERRARPTRAARSAAHRSRRSAGGSLADQGIPAGFGDAAAALARIGGPGGGRGGARDPQRTRVRAQAAEGGMIAVIARNTVREVLRDRVWFVLLGFGFVLLRASRMLRPRALGEGPCITVDLGLTAVSGLGLLVVAVVGASLVHQEIERRTVHVILARPISRATYLVGKWAGLTLAVWITGAITGVALVSVTLLVR